MTMLPCDPTMLFMAAVLANVEKKLDAIQETQEEILEYLKDRDRAELQANLNALGKILNEIKFNWNNETFKQNKLQLIQDTIVAADKNINLYRSQIAKRLKKRTAMMQDIQILATEARQFALENNDFDEPSADVVAEYCCYGVKLIEILQNTVPELLKDEEFFASVFFPDEVRKKPWYQFW